VVRRFFLWFVPAAIGALTGGLLTAGAWAGLSGKLGQPVGDAPPPAATPAPALGAASGGLRIAALGDSLTRGAGDNAGGYSERVAQALRKAGRAVSLANLGVDGLETADLLRKLEDRSMLESLKGAGLILLSISGNDLSRSFPRGAVSGEGSDPTIAALARAAANVRKILAAVREANPSAPIRLLGLYDPFPTATGDRRLAKELLLRWNVALEQAAYTVPDALVVPTADLFEGRTDRLSADRFHPGPSGYAEIAARIVSTLRVEPAETAPAARQSAG
jgi:lysophospholipase L1-like esterase